MRMYICTGSGAFEYQPEVIRKISQNYSKLPTFVLDAHFHQNLSVILPLISAAKLEM